MKAYGITQAENDSLAASPPDPDPQGQSKRGSTARSCVAKLEWLPPKSPVAGVRCSLLSCSHHLRTEGIANMSAIEQIHRDIQNGETDIARDARERVLRVYRPTAADLLDGGAGLRERIRVAEQSAEAVASEKDGIRREALLALASATAAYEEARADFDGKIPEWDGVLTNLRACRALYESAHNRALALKIDGVPTRVPPLATYAAMHDRALQLAYDHLRSLLNADL